MVLNITYINNFIKFFNKYNNDFHNLNGSQIGSYKAHHQEAHIALTSEIELSTSTFCHFFHDAFVRCNISPDDISPLIFSFLNKIIRDGTDQSYAQSKFTMTEISYFKDFIQRYSDSFEGHGITNPFVSRIENTVDPETIPSNSQTVITLSDLNKSSNSTMFESLFDKMEQSLIGIINKTIHDKVGEELIKHLGVNKNLTSYQINECRNKLGYTYQNIMKKENQIKILESHLILVFIYNSGQGPIV